MIYTVEELVESIAKYVAEYAWKQSRFLTAEEEWNVNVVSLLDHLNEVTGISKEQIVRWVDEVADVIDANRIIR